ncbi:MAG: cation transporter [Chloroflexota bacterium]
MTTAAAALTTERRDVLRRRIRLVVMVTIAYNLIEGLVSVATGASASSSALIAFGLDSFVEVLSAVAVAWQFSRSDPERYEQATLRVIAFAFFALAAWVTINALLMLAGVWDAQPSPLGIIIATLSAVIMPALSWWERRTGLELGSATAVADSRQTLLCAGLSVAVLIGLVANVLFGWAWADPVAALVIAAFAVREGREAWGGDTCNSAVAMVISGEEETGPVEIAW